MKSWLDYSDGIWKIERKENMNLGFLKYRYYCNFGFKDDIHVNQVKVF